MQKHETDYADSMDLSRLGRRSFISQSGIAEVLAAVKQHGELPDGISRSAVKRKRQQAVDLTTPYGKLLQQWEFVLSDGSRKKIFFSPPAAAVWLSSHIGGMQQLLEQKLAAHPSNLNSQWDIIVYLDEVSPGNQLKSDNRRKLWCVYYSFGQFREHLSKELAWFVLCTVRAELVQQLKGGVSELIRQCLWSFHAGHGDFSNGIQLASSKVLFGKIAMLLGDEAALKAALECKGAAGKVLCFRCQTTLQKRYASSDLEEPWVLHTCTDSAKFRLHTNESVWRTVDLLAARSRTETKERLPA